MSLFNKSCYRINGGIEVLGDFGQTFTVHPITLQVVAIACSCYWFRIMSNGILMSIWIRVSFESLVLRDELLRVLKNLRVQRCDFAVSLCHVSFLAWAGGRDSA